MTKAHWQVREWEKRRQNERTIRIQQDRYTAVKRGLEMTNNALAASENPKKCKAYLHLGKTSRHETERKLQPNRRASNDTGHITSKGDAPVFLSKRFFAQAWSL